MAPSSHAPRFVILMGSQGSLGKDFTIAVYIKGEHHVPTYVVNWSHPHVPNEPTTYAQAYARVRLLEASTTPVSV